MACTIFENDVGTIFKVKIVDCDTGDVIDISAATTLQITFKKPDKKTVTKTAAFSTDGSDGYLQYVVVDGDIDMVGIWNLQAYVAGVGFKNNSTVGTFVVDDNL